MNRLLRDEAVHIPGGNEKYLPLMRADSDLANFGRAIPCIHSEVAQCGLSNSKPWEARIVKYF